MLETSALSPRHYFGAVDSSLQLGTNVPLWPNEALSPFLILLSEMFLGVLFRVAKSARPSLEHDSARLPAERSCPDADVDDEVVGRILVIQRWD